MAEYPTPRYEQFMGKDGRMHCEVVYHCPICRDTGLITWEDEDQRLYGRPCDCENGYRYKRRDSDV